MKSEVKGVAYLSCVYESESTLQHVCVCIVLVFVYWAKRRALDQDKSVNALMDFRNSFLSGFLYKVYSIAGLVFWFTFDFLAFLTPKVINWVHQVDMERVVSYFYLLVRDKLWLTKIENEKKRLVEWVLDNCFISEVEADMSKGTDEGYGGLLELGISSEDPQSLCSAGNQHKVNTPQLRNTRHRKSRIVNNPSNCSSSVNFKITFCNVCVPTTLHFKFYMTSQAYHHTSCILDLSSKTAWDY